MPDEITSKPSSGFHSDGQRGLHPRGARSGVPGASFPNESDRSVLLRDMCEESRRSLLFLKSLRRVVIGEIVEKRWEEWASVEAKRTPSTGSAQFAKQVAA